MQEFRVFLTTLAKLLEQERFVVDAVKRSNVSSLGQETLSIKIVDKSIVLLEIDASDSEGYVSSGVIKTHYLDSEMGAALEKMDAKKVVSILKEI